MQLKLKLSILSVLVLGALLSCMAAVHSFALVKQQAAEVQPPPVAQKYTDLNGAAYVLKESNGYVAVFSAHPEKVLNVTDIPVSGLRAADQALLRSGITAADEQALLELLEDFGS